MSHIAQQEEPPERQYPERILAVAAGSALALVPSVWVIVRLRRRRRQVRGGYRIPVTVYYGSHRGALTGAIEAQGSCPPCIPTASTHANMQSPSNSAGQVDTGKSMWASTGAGRGSPERLHGSVNVSPTR